MSLISSSRFSIDRAEFNNATQGWLPMAIDFYRVFSGQGFEFPEDQDWINLPTGTDGGMVMGFPRSAEAAPPPPALSLACPVDTSITLGVPYEGQLIASNGVEPYVFEIIDGELPPGLTLDEDTGIISGTPTSAGGYAYTAQVTDAEENTAEAECGFAVGGPCEQQDRTGVPKFYFWEPSFIPRPEDTFLRATDWDDLGDAGSKFLQGFILQADTGGVGKAVVLQGDQGNLETYVFNHDGLCQKPYVLDPPRLVNMVRLLPTNAVGLNGFWRYFGVKWVFEPAPEMVTLYQTQGTSHDMPGYQFLKDGYIAHVSNADITLTITVDDTDFVYTIPSSAGEYVKSYILFAIEVGGRCLKGKVFTYKLQSAEPFALYKRDCEVRVHSWMGGDYQVKQPFGDLHRDSGARI